MDFCLPECSPKQNYALIGPGVSQSADQPVNLREPHGFQVGGVSMPPGKVNPPHLHFTCEVFFCAKGTWEIQWGFNPEVRTLVLHAGDIAAIPTWIYRGFKNIGSNDGFMFTALGRDDTGGILWGPSTIHAAQERGVYLTRDHKIVDTRDGASPPAEHERFEPMSPSDIASLRDWSRDEMSKRVFAFGELSWHENALLDSLLEGGGATIAPVFGYGMCEHRSCLPRPMNPVGLSMEWIRIPAGCRIGRHRLSVKQVLIVYQGSLCLHLSDVEETEQYRLNGESDAWDTFSVPEYVWRELCADQAQDVIILSMLATDDRKMIDWDASILARAKIQGLMRDADGYIAPKRLVERA
ncbi:MAG: cupin domain-containing protein [Betaproteobacteria bacterium]|nr:cupin domain-containing protein [Betaproteobacteria bacterium]